MLENLSGTLVYWSMFPWSLGKECKRDLIRKLYPMTKAGFSTMCTTMAIGGNYVLYYGNRRNPISWEPSELSKLAQLFGRRLDLSLQATFSVPMILPIS